MFPPQSTPSKRPKRRVESYRIYKRPYSACSQSSRPSPSSYEKATHGRLVGPTLSTPRGDNNYNQYRPLCEVCPRDRDKVVGTLQGSILGDGSTDKGIIEQELVYVRFVDRKGQIQTKLGDIVDLEQGNAKGVKDGWLKGLDSLGITEQVLAEKLVAVNTDGASVNLGKKGGAVKLLLDDINELLDDNKTCNGYVTVVHCIAHKLELAVCDAKKGCDYLTEFEKKL